MRLACESTALPKTAVAAKDVARGGDGLRTYTSLDATRVMLAMPAAKPLREGVNTGVRGGRGGGGGGGCTCLQ